MANQRTTVITIGALLLVGATRAWAGPGDIDANFGNRGHLELSETTLVLPDDRLVIGYNAANLMVARFDSNGKVDASFADGGETRIPLPVGWSRFYPSYASAIPDGGLLFAGYLRNFEPDEILEAVLRLDRDGRLVRSFGGHSDGHYRLADAPLRLSGYGIPTNLVAIAEDGVGRVLLAERSWTADGRCGGPTSVVRLTASGTPDPTFGTSGRADVPGVDLCGGAALFGVRTDGSVVVGARGAMVGLNAGGALDPAFGVGGHVSHGRADDWGRGALLPDGGILIVERDNSTTASNAVLTKFDRGGELDSTFGAGSGSVALDFGAAFFGVSDSRQTVQDFVLTPDATHVYLRLAVLRPDGTMACAGGISRVSLDGTPDLSFGKQGLTCLDYGAFPFLLVASQRNGSLLFAQPNRGDLYRLLADDTPSPGIVAIAHGATESVGEASGTVAVRMVRTAGHDGAVSVSFSTGPRHPDGDEGNGPRPPMDATPGSDFLAASGQIDWADGDEAEREITVTILDDEIGEYHELFGVDISNPRGGALILRYGTFYLPGPSGIDIGISDDDEAAAPTDPTPVPIPTPVLVPTSGGSSSGGGSLSWATLLGVSGLLLQRQRHQRRTRARNLRIRQRLRGMRPIAHWTAPRRCEATRRLASIIALLSALFVLTVFGIARMPSDPTNHDQATHDGSTQPRLTHFAN